jgi:uracil-DNA glycosylase family 4
VSNARELLARYLAQRESLGEGPLVFDSPPGEVIGDRGKEPRQQELGRRRAKIEEVEGGRARPDEGRQDAAPRRRAAGGKATDWREGAPPVPDRGLVIPAPSSDLFSADELGRCDLAEIATRVGECTACRLHENRTNAVPGEGPEAAKLVVVGEGPGAKEDETGRPFVGRAGEKLDEILNAIDLPREQVFICNIVKCRPPGNRTPQQEEIDHCVPYLYRQLELIGPRVILAMGGTAAQTLLQTKQSLGGLRNRVHSFRGMPLVVTYHPAALLRNPNWKKPTWDDVRIARQLVDG